MENSKFRLHRWLMGRSSIRAVWLSLTPHKQNLKRQRCVRKSWRCGFTPLIPKAQLTTQNIPLAYPQWDILRVVSFDNRAIDAWLLHWTRLGHLLLWTPHMTNIILNDGTHSERTTLVPYWTCVTLAHTTRHTSFYATSCKS